MPVASVVVVASSVALLVVAVVPLLDASALPLADADAPVAPLLADAGALVELLADALVESLADADVLAAPLDADVLAEPLLAVLPAGEDAVPPDEPQAASTKASTPNNTNTRFI